MLRAILGTLFALLAGAHAIRTAAVAALAENSPASVSALWPGHPDILRSVAMAEVGGAAGQGREPPAQAMARLEQLARAQPLAPEPYLIPGAIAQRSGDLARAEQLFLLARTRDPRSAAARFLLADLYFRTGRVQAGLAEMSVLGRLIRGAMQQVAPALAAYASGAGAVPHLKRILIAYPELERPLLAKLAEEPANADLIVALARPGASEGEPPRWQKKLLDGMIEAGAYDRAHAVWAKLSGLPAQGSRGLFNPDFADAAAPPPFNWALASGSDGVAEPGRGGLRVLYFGREDAVLASQLMLLAPGRYRLEMTLAGQPGEDSEIGWSVTCLPGNSELLNLPLGGAGGIAAEFAVPASNCPAQRFELKGAGQEFPRSADFRIDGLRLARIGG